jgi:SWIM/SEC-C metal-binding protein
MGNRITNIGKMKSIVDADNRLRTGEFKKATAKLGTEKNPAVVHVRTEERLKELTSVFEKKGWNYKIRLDPDKPEDITDLERLSNPTKPMRVEKKIGRNEPCSCGSGKKYKHCCGHS